MLKKLNTLLSILEKQQPKVEETHALVLVLCQELGVSVPKQVTPAKAPSKKRGRGKSRVRANQNKRWTHKEVTVLGELYREGRSFRNISAVLGRSRSAVNCQLFYMRKSGEVGTRNHKRA